MVHSGLTPIFFFTSFAYLTVSALMQALNAAGVDLPAIDENG